MSWLVALGAAWYCAVALFGWSLRWLLSDENIARYEMRWWHWACFSIAWPVSFPLLGIMCAVDDARHPISRWDK